MRSIALVVFRAVVAGALGSLTAFAAAGVLWSFPGTTVTNGPAFASLACLVICTVGFLVVLRVRVRGRRAMLYRQFLLGIEVVVLGLALLVWRLGGSYFVGWLATFASVVLASIGTWQLLGELVTTTIAPTASRVVALRRRHTVSTCILTAVTAVVGVGGLVATAAVHTWQLGIVSPLVVLVSAALLFAVAIARVLTAAGTRAPRGARR